MKITGNTLWKNGFTVVLALSLAALACQFPGAGSPTAEVLQTNTPDIGPEETEVVSPSDTPEIVLPTDTPDVTFQIQRQAARVLFGAADPLGELTTNDAQPFQEGSLITTDPQGEALISGELEGEQCSIFVFFNSQLRKSACPESALTSGNASCLESGSAVFQNCANHLVMTPSGNAQLLGTWVQVVYLPEQRMSAYVVADGRVQVQPIDQQGLAGNWTTVRPGEFYYTSPDMAESAVPTLPRRQVLSWDRLPALVQFYNLTDYIGRGTERAVRSGFAYRDAETLLGPADLIVEVELANPSERGFPLDWYNRLSDNYYKIPIRMRITNRGGKETGEFKLSAEGGTPDNWFVRPLAGEDQPQEGFYAYVREGILPGGELNMYGMIVITDTLLATQPLSFIITVDSCAGDEIFTKYCRVDESDEGNNLSTQIDVPPRG
ncbi:MAG TPA: hypothetical protein VN363_09215 [Anaerolineales bacterium]|nr:hypothetical protein [Anaerolineales bacterium]